MTETRRHRIRSTPLRLTVQLVLIFAVTVMACFGASYVIARQTIDAGLRAEIEQAAATLREATTRADFEDRFRHLAEATPRRSMLMEWRGPAGETLGNASGLPMSPGFTVIGEDAVAQHDPTAADSYLIRSYPLLDGTLTFARSREAIVELGETFSAVIIFGLIPALLLSTILGFWVATRTETRIEAIRTTLSRMQDGELTARVPDPSRDDDLSSIAGAVNDMGASLSAAMQAVRQVSTDIAHDLRTPIQRVQVLLDRIEDTEMNPAQAELVARAREETEGITRTFRSMLQIARIEGGGARDSFEEVDLSEVAETMVSVYALAAEDAGQSLTLTAASGQMVRGEKQLLQQALANLIENAIRHGPPGNRIAVAVDPGTPVVLRVTDTGPGIPEAERDKVLRRLYRLERSRTTEGSGLGLSLVAAICDLHGASLSLGDAEPGLAVTIRFPG